MDQAEYSRIAAAEDLHWWYRSTRALMADLLGDRLFEGMRVLDAGCGPGGNGAWLSDWGSVSAIDVAPEAIRFVRSRHPRVDARVGKIEAIPFDDDAFDLAIAITVIALVEDDRRAVSELARVTRPGGTVMLMEPANPRLRREHDVVTHTRRRYRLPELEELAKGEGLEVVRSTHAYSFLVPPAAALALLHRVRPRPRSESSDLQRDRLGTILGGLASIERRMIRSRQLPFGLSVAVVAEVPG